VKTYTDINDIGEIRNPIITVGTFDGVHRGHQMIVRHVVEAAKKIDGESMLMTFEPHPRKVVQPGYNLKLILSMSERERLFEQLGIDHLIIIHFTKEFSQLSSENFLVNYVFKPVKPVKMIIGYDHQFGKDRRGDIHFLRQMAGKHGFAVEQLEMMDIEGEAISSTKIREAIKTGDMKLASMLLGFNYSISGTVVMGNQIGRTLGFPTANIRPDEPEKLIPYYGVYAAMVEHDGKMYKGMSNIGIRPTLNEHHLTIEVNIFDFDKDIYGDKIRLFFIEHTRDEKRFRDLDLLRRRLIIDKRKVKKILDEASEMKKGQSD
jgi:riboflavin kinase / FMN adenylyltransferase